MAKAVDLATFYHNYIFKNIYFAYERTVKRWVMLQEWFSTFLAMFYAHFPAGNNIQTFSQPPLKFTGADWG